MNKKLALAVLIFSLVIATLACRIPWVSPPLPTVNSPTIDLDLQEETSQPDQTKANTPTTIIPTSTATGTHTGNDVPALPHYPEPVIFNFEIFTPLRGWAVTQDENHLLITFDGGEIWFETTPSDLNPLSTGGTSLGIQPFFLDENTAWFTPFTSETGTLYHTNDGGISWSITALPFGNARYYFLDTASGFALVDIGAGAGSHYVALYRTSDGGASWTEVFSHEPGESKSLPESGSKSGVTFMDNLNGWVGGVVPMTDYFYLHVTTDGGATWTQETDISLPDEFAGSMLEVDQPMFVNTTVGFLPVSTYDSVGNRILMIYRSDDSGQTWVFQNSIQNGRVVDFVTADLGWIASDDGLYQSQDGGLTWSMAETSGIPVGEFFLNVDFVDEQHGWTLTTPDSTTWDPLKFYRTTDGGENWTLLLP